MPPAVKRPMLSLGSPARFGRRNQSTSIGAPRSSPVRPGARANGRVPAVAADGEVGAHSSAPSGVLARTPAMRPPSSMRSTASARICRWNEGKLLPCSARKLRKSHCGIERNELAAGGEMGEIRQGVFPVAEEGADGRRLSDAAAQEIARAAELAHHFERRGMDGVAAKIAQKVGMLLEHDHIDAGAREQEAEHEPAWASADDGAPGGSCSAAILCCAIGPRAFVANCAACER